LGCYVPCRGGAKTSKRLPGSGKRREGKKWVKTPLKKNQQEKKGLKVAHGRQESWVPGGKRVAETSNPLKPSKRKIHKGREEVWHHELQRA